jgi:hypothetical protein
MQLIHTTTILLTALALSATATPLDNINKRTENSAASCSYNGYDAWQGGGCKTNWGGGKCHTQCVNTSGGRNCCPEEISSEVTNEANCFPGWSTCECFCATN